MKRDPLQVLWRLRDAALTEATRELAGGLHREREARERALGHGQKMAREQAESSPTDAADFAQWLPRARNEAARLDAALKAAHGRVAGLQQALIVRRTDVEAVVSARDRRRMVEESRKRGAEQAVMDEAAGRRGRTVPFGKTQPV